MMGTPTPPLDENYAKEAPAPAAIAPLETSTPEGTPMLDNQDIALTAQSTSQNRAPSTHIAKAAGFSTLRILEVVFAVTALVTAALFFIQKRKSIE
jgi:hypothetical protein